MSANRVIRISFMTSLIGHCLFLSMPGFDLSSAQTEMRDEIAVRIEIEKPPLLPKIDVIGEEKKLKQVIEIPEPEPEPEMEPELQLEEMDDSHSEVELTDSKEEAMFRYQDVVKQRIEELRRYPSRAKRRGVEGETRIKFAISSNGLVQNIKIISASGSKRLDEEAVNTIRRASPFPPVPEEIDRSPVWMEVSIVFTLKYE